MGITNNGGWQWTASTDTDAVPYFCVFNPVLQGKKIDPKGGYMRIGIKLRVELGGSAG